MRDYKLNLIVPREIENFGRFKTDFGAVMRYISCAKDEDAMQEFYDEARKEEIVLSKEAAQVLNTCMNADIEIDNDIEGGNVSMCIAMDAIIAKREAQAEARLLVKMLRNYMQRNKATLEEACEVLGITLEDYNSAKELLTADK